MSNGGFGNPPFLFLWTLPSVPAFCSAACLQRAPPQARARTATRRGHGLLPATPFFSLLPELCSRQGTALPPRWCAWGEGPPSLENKAWFTVAASPVRRSSVYTSGTLWASCAPGRRLRERSPLWAPRIRSRTAKWTHTCMFLVRVPRLPSGSWKESVP